MTIKVGVTFTKEELTTLDTAMDIISKMADDIENEDINTFAGMDYHDLNRLASEIEDITTTIRKWNNNV